MLVITEDIDKGKYGRLLPLTPRAQAALDSIANATDGYPTWPEVGPKRDPHWT